MGAHSEFEEGWRWLCKSCLLMYVADPNDVMLLTTLPRGGSRKVERGGAQRVHGKIFDMPCPLLSSHTHL